MNRYLTRTEFVAAIRKMADHIEKKEDGIESVYFPNGRMYVSSEDGYIEITMNDNVELKMKIFKRSRDETMADIEEESEKEMDEMMKHLNEM